VSRNWDDFRTAGAFLTVFPVANRVEMDAARLARSMGWFPAVGLLLGLLLVIGNWALSALLPRAVVDGLLILLLITATGALHLDGVADLFDGLAGGRDRESTLRIMKDSRVGAIGVVALVMVLLLKYLSLNQLPLAQKNAALLFMPAAGRWCQVFLANCATYIRPEGGTGSAFVANVGRPQLLGASLILLLAVLLLFSFKGLLLLGLLLLDGTLLWLYFERRLGGVTGDVLGASAELTEVVFLLLLLALY